jgi:hypothetical protein
MTSTTQWMTSIAQWVTSYVVFLTEINAKGGTFGHGTPVGSVRWKSLACIVHTHQIGPAVILKQINTRVTSQKRRQLIPVHLKTM